MSHCPSCGQYVGGSPGTCTYCGARITGRISIRLVKLAAIALTTVGLAVLWWFARRAEIPTLPISQIGATMNLAYVQVEGRCTRPPSYDPQTEYLGFWVADDTGELYVTAYRNETRSLVEEGRVPALGDKVAVAGTLRVRDDFRSLTVNVPGDLKIARAKAQASPLGAITPDQVYRRVRVRGQVRQVVEPYAGLTLITLRDETGTLDVALSDDLVALSPVSPVLKTGQAVEVVATVSRYQGEVQLVPASLDHVLPLDDEVPIAVNRFVTELSPEDAGAWVTLRGAVTTLDLFSKGLKLRLDDGTGAVTVLLWQDVYDEFLRRSILELVPGAEIEVHGELAKYRGELEVIPELADDVCVLATPSPQTATPWSTRLPPTHVPPTSTALVESTSLPPPSVLPTPRPTLEPSPVPTRTVLVTAEVSPTPRVDLTPLRAIGPDHVGQEVTVEGDVVGADSFSHGFRFTLDDGGGRIVLLMWHDVYDECWDRVQIRLGATVRATGQVSQYEGQLQVEPRFGGDVRVTRASNLRAPLREIGSIAAADQGQRVMIEGQVVRTEGLPSAVKVFLRDDGPEAPGEIPVLVWRNVLERVVDNVGLGTPDSRVRVVGTVQIYRSNLEIVPVLPTDVTVLEIP